MHVLSKLLFYMCIHGLVFMVCNSTMYACGVSCVYLQFTFFSASYTCTYFRFCAFIFKDRFDHLLYVSVFVQMHSHKTPNVLYVHILYYCMSISFVYSLIGPFNDLCIHSYCNFVDNFRIKNNCLNKQINE